MGINAGTHRGSCSHRWHSATFSGGESRSALMCLRFIPCYKSGCGELRGVTRRSRNAFEPQLAYNGLQLNEVADYTSKFN